MIGEGSHGGLLVWLHNVQWHCSKEPRPEMPAIPPSTWRMRCRSVWDNTLVEGLPRSWLVRFAIMPMWLQSHSNSLRPRIHLRTVSQRVRMNANSGNIDCAAYHSTLRVRQARKMSPWHQDIRTWASLLMRRAVTFGRANLCGFLQVPCTVTRPFGKWRWHLSAVRGMSDSRRLLRSLPRTKWCLVWKPVLCIQVFFFFHSSSLPTCIFFTFLIFFLFLRQWAWRANTSSSGRQTLEHWADRRHRLLPNFVYHFQPIAKMHT